MNETLKGVAHIGAELAAAKADLQREMERHRKTWRQLEQVKGLLRDVYAYAPISEKFRIDAALSQQAEPKCCTPTEEELQLLNNGDYTPEELWGASAPSCPKCAKPAPAQDDDDYMPEGIVGAIMHSETMDAPEMAANALRGQLSAPAQTEQQPVAYADPQAFVNFDKARQEGIEAGPRTHEWMWANPGSCLVPLFAAPIAQTAPQVPERLPVEPYQTVERSSTNYKAGWNACRKAMLEGQAAPQPEQSGLVAALEYYANGDHLLLADPDEWDTCSGEPANFLHDGAGTASVEDGSIAKVALEAYRATLSAQGGDA